MQRPIALAAISFGVARGAPLGRGAASTQRYFVGLGLLAVVMLALVRPIPSIPGIASLERPAVPAPAALDSATKQEALDAYARLPLAFVPNAGQTDQSVRYHAQGAGFSFYFTDHEAVLAFEKDGRGQALRLRFVGANPNAELKAADRGTGKVNYLTASERHTNLPTFERLVYRDLWPGIDMVFGGEGGKLNYEFHLRPGAKVSDIRLAYAGAKGVSLGAGGALLVDTSLGILRDAPPQSFQRIDGRRVPVDSRYALAGNSYGFAVGHHDRGQPLVIDPSLAYSTYLGGSAGDQGRGIAVDSAGAAYVTGVTASADFPITAGAFNTSYNGGFEDAFVTKLNPAGSSPLAYSTYLGGSSSDDGFGIAVDSAGAVYVTGLTDSADFPTTAGAFDTSANGSGDAFVSKLDATGSSLAYSTFLGGSSFDQGFGIAINPSGAAYVTGLTDSGDFPTTAGAFDTTRDDFRDAFVTKLDPVAFSPLAYSTYLGGNSSEEEGRGIAVDSAGAAYVTGLSFSTNFPTTLGAFDTTANGGGDAFITKLDPVAFSPLAYSTYLGGSSADQGLGIAVDLSGAAYVTGRTASADFPTTAGAFDTTLGGSEDAFITKLDPVGSSPLAYSTYLGGSSADQGLGIAVDLSGAAYVTGRTASADFPTTAGAFDTSFNFGVEDAFMSKLDPVALSPLVYSTYLGGSSVDEGFGIAVHSGAVYLTGRTGPTFPTTAAAFDTSANGTDAFVTKLDLIPTFVPATVTLSPPDAVNTVGTQHTVTATVTDATGGPVSGVTVLFSVQGSVSKTDSCTTDANGRCSFTYVGPQLPGADVITGCADSNGNGTADRGEEPCGVATKAWLLPTSSPGQVTGGGQVANAVGNDQVAFGFNAKSGSTGVKGECTLVDPSTNTKLKCLDATSLIQTGTHATFFGNATVNGVATTYRIDVDDLAEPGAGRDTFKIQTANGYTVGGVLLRGNIQVHN